MRIKKTLFAGMSGVLSISLLVMVMSCAKSNPVKPTIITPIIITPSGTMTDIDGNVYQTVKIGNQVWMAENLRTTKYNDGSVIPLTDSAAWYNIDNNNLQTPAYCYYNNMTNADSIKKWGALYNWYVVNTGKLAPAGWHVPTDSEWTIMENYLVLHGYNYDGTTDTSSYNELAIALAAKTDWHASTRVGYPGNNLTKNNSGGFSAIPGGYRNNDGKFGGVGDCGYWWSAKECAYSLYYDISSLGSVYASKSDGFSVRLVKDN